MHINCTGNNANYSDITLMTASKPSCQAHLTAKLCIAQSNVLQAFTNTCVRCETFTYSFI